MPSEEEHAVDECPFFRLDKVVVAVVVCVVEQWVERWGYQRGVGWTTQVTQI